MKFNSILETVILETITFEKRNTPGNEQNGAVYYNFHDEVGGHGFLKITHEDDETIADIISWDSIPSNVSKYGEEAEHYKRRGFATEVIKAIKDQLKLNTIRVALQSNDATASLRRLTQKGLIIPDTRYTMGPSQDEHFVRFKIN